MQHMVVSAEPVKLMPGEPLSGTSSWMSDAGALIQTCLAEHHFLYSDLTRFACLRRDRSLPD